MEENRIPEAPNCQLAGLSPDEVHKNIMRCYKLKNRIDKRQLEWILVLIEGDFCVALGSPHPVFYVKKHLQCEKTEAYDIIKTAKALPHIPRSAKAFEEGDISWAKMKQIARVAGEETDGTWLEFAKTHKPGELKAQVRDALKTNRKEPRRDGRGLTNLNMNLVFRLPLEIHEIVRKALEKTTDLMREVKEEFSKDEGRYPTQEEAMEFLARKVLETDLVGELGKKSERERAAYDCMYILFKQNRGEGGEVPRGGRGEGPGPGQEDLRTMRKSPEPPPASHHLQEPGRAERSVEPHHGVRKGPRSHSRWDPRGIHGLRWQAHLALAGRQDRPLPCG